MTGKNTQVSDLKRGQVGSQMHMELSTFLAVYSAHVRMIQRIFTSSSLFIHHLLVTKPGIFHFFLWTKARTVEWELAIQQRKLFVKLGSWRHWEEKALMKLATVCANCQDFMYSSKEPWLRLFMYLLFTSHLLERFALYKRTEFVRNAILETGSFLFAPATSL